MMLELDCISRQAVLDEMMLIPIAPLMVGDRVVYKKGVLEGMIKALPSVTPKPKTGHWIMTDDTNWYDAYFKCSCCGREIGIPYDLRNQVINKYPYCHCGAKMEVSE